MNRRSLILGLTAALAAPAIVKADSIMRVRSTIGRTSGFMPVNRNLTAEYIAALQRMREEIALKIACPPMMVSLRGDLQPMLRHMDMTTTRDTLKQVDALLADVGVKPTKPTLSWHIDPIR
jgi:hypothetical protein